MPDGADAKAEFAETLMKFRVSLQQVYQCIRIGRLYNVRQIFNVAKLHICSTTILQYNYPCYANHELYSYYDLLAKGCS